MKKILFLLLPAVLLFSCSQDSELTDNESSSSLTEGSSDMESQRQALLDSDTYMGIYKGVFTTNNSAYRATVEVIIPNPRTVTDRVINKPTAILTLVDGTTVTATAQPSLTNNVRIENLRFNSSELSFNLSVNLDGSDAAISDVIFKQENAAIFVTKHSNRAPITPITGTYVCTECQDHPYLNSGSEQSWNVVIDENSGEMISQVAFGSMVFNGIGQRSNCSPDGDYTYCSVDGGDGDSDIAFTAMGGEVRWSGSLQFNNLPPNSNTDCSEMNGTWTYITPTYGTITGTFVSDSTCEPTGPFTLLDEDFQEFQGRGFKPGVLPSTGMLDSNMYRVYLREDTHMQYGDTRTTFPGPYARGFSDGGATDTGIYAFRTGDGNIAAGVKPGNQDWTPGFVGIKIENTSGTTLSSVDLSFDLYVNNTGNRRSIVQFAYSTDGGEDTFTSIPGLDYISPGTSDSLGFQRNPGSTTINVTVADGEFIYLRLKGDYYSGTGRHDEFSIDNLLITAQ